MKKLINMMVAVFVASCAMSAEDTTLDQESSANHVQSLVKHILLHPEVNNENFITLDAVEECGINFASKTCEQPPYVCEEGNELATCVEE